MIDYGLLGFVIGIGLLLCCTGLCMICHRISRQEE